ncbi:MAG: hypothetical protein LBR53_06635 [Deltaproteobacteria bacterium]|jgi:hypothetical protein|nr:hypothetical protein [Deltaproteobacteria bacterium]
MPNIFPKLSLLVYVLCFLFFVQLADIPSVPIQRAAASRAFDSESDELSKGLDFTVEIPDYSFQESGDWVDGQVLALFADLETNVVYSIWLGVYDLPDGFSARSLKKEDGSYDQDKINALWESKVKEDGGTILSRSWGANPSILTRATSMDSAFQNKYVRGVKYALKDDKLVNLECSVGFIFDYGKGAESEQENYFTKHCQPYLNSLKFHGGRKNITMKTD